MSTIRSDLFVTGNLKVGSMEIPDGTVVDADVSLTAKINATKLGHQHAVRYSQTDGSDVVSEKLPIHTVRGVNGSVIELEVIVVAPPSGGDKQFTVDLTIANQASPTPVSILSAPITVDSAKAAFEVLTATISSAALLSGDTLQVEVTASGTTGNQGQGVVVTTNIREDAE